MEVRVLGCHGSELRRAPEHRDARCCGFLIDGRVLIDAGTIGAGLTLDEQLDIRTICLTHLHFDHIQALPTFADNVMHQIRQPVRITAIPAVLKGLQRHIFNGAVYPDFFALPHPDRPVLTAQPIAPRVAFATEGLEITSVPVNHLVPTVGFLIRNGSSSILYSGDTGATEELWSMAMKDQTLKAAFIETSFPNELEELALASKHLTPSLLNQELRKLGRPDIPLYLYHLKPSYKATIEQQIRDLKLPNVTILSEGMEITV